MITIIWIAAIIVIFITLLITSLIVIARREARLLHKRMTANLKAVVDREGLRIDEMDFLMRRIIAIDDTRKVLLYIDCNGSDDVVEMFDYAQIAKCRIGRTGNGLCEFRNGMQIADEQPGQIGLSLVLRNRTERFLQFYDEIKDGPDERPHLEDKAVKWCGILNRGPARVSTLKTS